MVSISSRKSVTRVAASVALVAGATAVAGLGTFGSFTSSTQATEAVSSGETKIELGNQAQGLDVAAVNLVPGDTVQRAVQLTRAGVTEGFGSVKLTTTSAAAAPSILTTDATNGLQLSIDQCSVPWVKSATTRAMTCDGATTSILAASPAVGANRDLAKVTETLNGEAKVSNLRLTLALPQAADNTFQLKSDTVKFVFDATQRAGEAR